VIVEDAHLPHVGTIVAASCLTVGLSVLLHGLSAAPLVSRYAAWYHAAADKIPPATESEPAPEHRTRTRAAPPDS
jgi:sodium/hydrogen antiporter